MAAPHENAYAVAERAALRERAAVADFWRAHAHALQAMPEPEQLLPAHAAAPPSPEQVRELITAMQRDSPGDGDADRLSRAQAIGVLQRTSGHGADLVIEIMRAQPTWVDPVFMYDKMSGNDFERLFLFWCTTVQPARGEVFDVVSRLPPHTRLQYTHVALDHVPHLTRGFIHWPCQEDTEFVALLAEMMPDDEDKSSILQEVFDHLVPLPTPGADSLSGEVFELYYRPVLSVGGPVYYDHRVPVIHSVVSSLDVVSPRFRDGLSSILTAGSPHVDREFQPRPMNDEERRLADCVVRDMCLRHELNLSMRARRAEVSAARDAVPAVAAAALVDEKAELEHKQCIVCMENKIANVFDPCGHLVTCHGCFARMPEPKRCPTCRAAIKRPVPCFL